MLALPRQGQVPPQYNGDYSKAISVDVQETLNDFMALGRLRWLETRAVLMKLLSEDVATLRDDKLLREAALLQQVRRKPRCCS